MGPSSTKMRLGLREQIRLCGNEIDSLSSEIEQLHLRNFEETQFFAILKKIRRVSSLLAKRSKLRRRLIARAAQSKKHQLDLKHPQTPRERIQI